MMILFLALIFGIVVAGLLVFSILRNRKAGKSKIVNILKLIILAGSDRIHSRLYHSDNQDDGGVTTIRMTYRIQLQDRISLSVAKRCSEIFCEQNG